MTTNLGGLSCQCLFTRFLTVNLLRILNIALHYSLAGHSLFCLFFKAFCTLFSHCCQDVTSHRHWRIQFSLHLMLSLHLTWLSVFALATSAQLPWNKVINKACRRFCCSEICWPMISLVCSETCGILALFIGDSTVKATLSFIMFRLVLLVGVLSC